MEGFVATEKYTYRPVVKFSVTDNNNGKFILISIILKDKKMKEIFIQWGSPVLLQAITIIIFQDRFFVKPGLLKLLRKHTRI